MASKTFSAKVEVAPKIVMTFEGSCLEDFEEDIRAGCLFAERCKFNQTRMMREEAGFVSIKNAADEIRKSFGAAGKRLFQTPACDTAKKFYDFDGRTVRSKPGGAETEPEEPAMPKAKASKSEEGTTHLSSDMSADELTAAISKGGMKTVDLDDVDELRKLLAAAKKRAASE